MLSDLIRERLGFAGDSLSAQVHKAGRTIPKHIRRDLMQVADAVDISGHPKLSRQVDDKKLARAAERASTWLLTYDRAGKRRGAALDLLAVIVFNLVLVAAVFVGILLWRNLL